MSVHIPKRSTVSRCHSSSKRIGTVKNGKSTMVTRGKAAQLKEREVHEVASILLSFAAKARVAPDRIKMPATQAELNSDKFPYSLFLLPPSSPLFSLLSPSSAEAMTIVEEALLPDTISNLSTKPKAAIGKKKRKRTTKAQLAVLEKVFESNKTPNREAREELGRLLGMSPRSVQIWYQNRRSKLKRGISMDKQKEASIPNVCLFPNMVTPQPVQRMEFSLPLIAPKGVSPIKQEESMKVDLTPGRGLRDQFTFSTIPSFSNFGVASPSLVQFSASSLVQVP